MFDKAKPTKQELNKLAKGVAAAGTLGDLITALERAIEAASTPISFVDGDARRELSRTQLSLGVSSLYLRRLIAASDAYLADLKSKPAAKKAAPKAKAKAKTGTKAKTGSKAKAKAPAKKAAKRAKR
jgi:hypothetical protein